MLLNICLRCVARTKICVDMVMHCIAEGSVCVCYCGYVNGVMLM